MMYYSVLSYNVVIMLYHVDVAHTHNDDSSI